MTPARATTFASWIRRRLTALLAALLVVPGAPLFAGLRSQDPAPAEARASVRGTGPGFTWESSRGLAGLAERFAAEIPAILEEARQWTGLTPDPRPLHLEWVADRAALARALGEPQVPEWFAAVAVPEQRRLILATSIAGSEAQLRATLRHELMHLAMADLGPAAYARLPAWFHEGCAQVFAGDVYLSQLEISLPWRAFTGELESLSEYRAGFGREPVQAAVGYALGQRYVARLQRVYGAAVLPALLARVAAGASLDAALLAETKLSEVSHEEALREELASAAALLADFYPHLFVVVALALLAVYPFWRAARRRRRRELEDRWARDDRRARLDPVLASGQWREPTPAGEAGAEEPEALDWWEEEKT